MLPTPLPSTSIVVLSFNQWHLTHRCLFELCNRLPETEIVVVDNASVDKDVKPGIEWWKSTPFAKKIEFVMLDENKGFGGGNNIGAKHAMGDILVFTQNDVMTYGDWLTPLRNILIDDPKAVVGGRIINWDGGWNSVPGHKFVPYAEGFLIGMWRKTWEDIGGFDERYFPCDMEDVDLSTTALYKGYHLVELSNDWFHHLGGQTINKLNIDRLKITQEHRTIFLEKWSSHWETINNVIKS